MSQLSDIINQINSLTGYSVSTGSGYILSQSANPIGSGSVNTIINYINSLTGYEVPTTDVQYVSGSNVAGPIIIYTPYAAGGTISTQGIIPGAIIKSEHVLRIINALNGVNINDVIISGSLTTSGSTEINGTFALPFIDDSNILITSGGLVVGTTTVPSASFAVTASYLSGSVSDAINAQTASNTPNAVITASVLVNTITFTKGDGTTFPITVNTGSGGGTVSGDYVTTSSFNAFTSSVVTTSSFNSFTQSYNTGSFTGSFVGDGSGLINVPTQLIDTGSLVTTASFNAFTSSVVTTSSFNAFTSSVVSTSSFNLFTGSYNTGSFTGSFIGSLQGTASYANSSSISISSSFASTASLAPNYVLNSVTRSFATTGSNTFIGNQTITGSFDVSGSISTNSNDKKFGQIGEGNNYFEVASDSWLATYIGGNQTGIFISIPNRTYLFGDRVNNNTQILIDDISQTITLTGSVLLNTITNTPQSNVVTIDTTTGQLYYTASSAFGGGPVDTSGFVTTSSFNNYTGSTTSQFAGTSSFALTASYAMNAGTTIDTGSFVTTSSFNAFTSSINQATQSLSSSIASLSSSFISFSGSYNTGSFTGSFTGSLQGTASWAHSSSVAISSSYAINGGVTQILQGSNITVSGNGTGQVTISSTGGGSSYNTATGSYGSFYSTVTQTNVASTARSMSLNVTDISNGVSISGSTNPFNTYIKTENAGIYNIQFSAQVDKTDSGTDEIWVWLRKNGSNIADSATSIQLVGNGAHYVAAWNFFVNSSANDYYQLMWYSPDANVRLHAEAGFGVVPGIPSLIVTVNRVDQFLSNTGSFSGSFTGVFTGSLQGTSSFALLATTATTANSVTPLNQNVIISGSLTVRPSSGRLSLVTDDYAAASAGSVINIQLGSATGDTYGLIENRVGGSISSGNLSLQGSGGNVAIGKTTFNAKLDVNGNAIVTGSLRVTAGITGSLEGTSSFATTASYALTSAGGGGGISQGKVVAIASGYSNLF